MSENQGDAGSCLGAALGSASPALLPGISERACEGVGPPMPHVVELAAEGPVLNRTMGPWGPLRWPWGRSAVLPMEPCVALCDLGSG